MGHAGAFIGPYCHDAQGKIRALENAGVTIVTHPAQLGDVMKPLLDRRANSSDAITSPKKVYTSG